MAISSIRCPVFGGPVTRVTDLEGAVTRVICPEYEESGACRLKRAVLNDGPLGQLLARTAESTLATRDTLCDLR